MRGLWGGQLRPAGALAAAAIALSGAGPANAQSALSGPPIHITRINSAINIDGELTDEGWKEATRVDTWFETNPGDNVPPKVRSIGYLAYDDHYFYAGFEFDDPNPRAIRAPYSDRDNISGSYTDYGGVILDTRNDGHSAVLLLVTPRGVQYDAISDDASGEDSSPDFFWDSAARITPRGWTAELRVPFSSLRYRNLDPQSWGLMLFRNYPRDFRYQIFSTKLPRGGNCFICRANTLVGLEHLPRNGHIVIAPFMTADETARPIGDPGTPLADRPLHSRVGLDVKWTPNADNAADFTVKPDFSQVESDTAQISTNERFALFYPEKRPFFLEGVNLLSTPLQAVYTRTIASPHWGGRLTGKEAGVGYTVLVTDDAPGSSVILPGPNASSVAVQDFGATVFVARAKREIGSSFISVLATSREAHDGNGYNRVVGPDFQWRPNGSDVITGQLLFSSTRTPNRPDLATEWNGQSSASQAAQVQWGHNTTHFDASAAYKEAGDGFRANVGFIPQVGLHEEFGGTGWTVRPQGFVRRLRVFLNDDVQADRSGALLFRSFMPGIGMDVKGSGFLQFRSINERIRTGRQLLDRQQFGYTVQFSPSRAISQISVAGSVGGDIDFDNSRTGRGGMVNASARLNPTNHLELALIQNGRWLDVADPALGRGRLFYARVSRVRATYTFTTRTFLRVIGQYVATTRTPSLYLDPTVAAHSGSFSGSALFAYKLNWQSVLFLGYGDDRDLSDQNRLERTDRQIFIKLSYAVQR